MQDNSDNLWADFEFKEKVKKADLEKGEAQPLGNEEEFNMNVSMTKAKQLSMAEKQRKMAVAQDYGFSMTGEPTSEQINKTSERIYIETNRKNPTSGSDMLIALAILLQKGGTSRGISAKEHARFGSATVDVRTVRDACKSTKITPRQLARSMRNFIINVVSDFDETTKMEGNLAKRFQRTHHDATYDELLWASDFQTHNTEAPERVRKWLIKDYEERFERKR